MGNISHSWNGTILTITSDSGTSSCDLKGEKGDTGIRGPQGVAGKTGNVNYKVLEDYPTKEEVTVQIAEAQLPEKDVDLSGYYARNEANSIFANTLKGSKSGEAVVANDISPVTHEMGIKVRSKNLFNNILASSQKGVDLTGYGDYWVLNGTCTESYNFEFQQANLQAGTYTFSTLKSNNIENNSNPLIQLQLQDINDGSFIYFDLNNNNVLNKSITFTVDKEYILVLRIRIQQNITYDNYYIYPQLELGATATAYTPYVPDLTAVKVSRCGKNLITFPYTYAGYTYGVGDTHRHNGVTFTVNADCSITANGTATAEAFFCFFDASLNSALVSDVNKQFVTLSGCPSGGSSTTYFLTQRNYGFKDVGSGIKFQTCRGMNSYAIMIKSGTTVENLVFKPQLELGTTKTEYEPYIAPTEYTPTADGTVEGVTAIYPTTTITTDTTGIVVDMEYNRDINKAFAELQQAIISLGGNV